MNRKIKLLNLSFFVCFFLFSNCMAMQEDEPQAVAQSDVVCDCQIKYPWLTTLNDKIENLCDWVDGSYYRSRWYRWGGHALRGSLLALSGRWVFLAADSAIVCIQSKIASNLKAAQDPDSYTTLHAVYDILDVAHVIIFAMQSGASAYVHAAVASGISMFLVAPKVDRDDELQRLRRNVGRLLQILLDIWVKYNQISDLYAVAASSETNDSTAEIDANNTMASLNQEFPCKTFIGSNGTAFEACHSGFHPLDTITHFREGGLAQRCFVVNNIDLTCTFCNPRGLCLRAHAEIKSIKNLNETNIPSMFDVELKLRDEHFVNTELCFCSDKDDQPPCEVSCSFQPFPKTMPHECRFGEKIWGKKYQEIHRNLAQLQRIAQELTSHTNLHKVPKIIIINDEDFMVHCSDSYNSISMSPSVVSNPCMSDVLAHEIGHVIQNLKEPCDRGELAKRLLDAYSSGSFSSEINADLHSELYKMNSISFNGEINADLLSALITQSPNKQADIFAFMNSKEEDDDDGFGLHPPLGTRCVYLREVAQIYKAIQEYFQRCRHLLLTQS